MGEKNEEDYFVSSRFPIYLFFSYSSRIYDNERREYLLSGRTGKYLPLPGGKGASKA
ncbi:unnamed protein product, partial [marine sediment metagenome]